MDVFETIKIRKSVRAYDSRPIPNEILLRILDAGRLAPSAGNIQPWHFVVVSDIEKRKRLAKARYARFLAEAPVVIVGCGNQKASPKWYMVDVTIALEHMVLTATNEGLGTCWIGSFSENEIREMLKIPENFRVIALLSIGYPRRKFDLAGRLLHFVRRRKKLRKIASLEEFGKFMTT
jgi:nitroreductase